MSRGSVFKRCQCRDAEGRKVKGCRKQHGSWAFTIDGPRDPVTGKRKQIPRSGFRTREDAEVARTKELASINAGTWSDDQGVTVAEWLDKWLADLASRGRSPKTLSNYRGHVRDVWRPKLGRLRLRDVRRAHIEQVIAELAMPIVGDRPPGNVGLWVKQRSPSTLAGYHRTIRAALAVAKRRELISVNPAEGHVDALPSVEADEEPAVWQPEETARFLEHVKEDRLSALYELAAYAGLRRAELCGLRWSDLDEDGAGLTVRQTVIQVARTEVPEGSLTCDVCQVEHVGRYFKRPKSRAGRRWVPLAVPAQRALARHWSAQKAEREFLDLDYSDHGLVFCDVVGLPLRPDAVTKAFEARVAACDLPVVRLHDTRHGACSLLLAGGVPIEVVQMILGHSSPAVTRKAYAHLMRKAAAEQVQTATELLTKHRPPADPEPSPHSGGSQQRGLTDWLDDLRVFQGPDEL